MEGSPPRTFKVRQEDDAVLESRDISTPFTTTAMTGGLGLCEAPPAPRKHKKSPTTALRSREIHLEENVDAECSGEAYCGTSNCKTSLSFQSPTSHGRQILQARSLNFGEPVDPTLTAREMKPPSAQRTGLPRVKELEKYFRGLDVEEEERHQQMSQKHLEDSAAMVSSPPGAEASTLQRKRQYREISAEPPATPAIDCKEQKRDAWLK